MSNDVSMRVKLQRMGSKLSGMVIPNLGAFVGWGLLTALAIWLDNDTLRLFIVPMLNYLLPVLIGVAAGRMVYGDKGGVIGAFATIGVIVGSDITMLLGAMIIAPIAAWVLKKVDKVVEPHIPVGFELLIGNFTSAIVGAVVAVFGCVVLAPAITSLSSVFAAGVDFLQAHNMLPLTAILIEPAKVVFLNNAIGQGVLTPLGTTQLAEAGKSVLFLLESNPGPGLGILLAYMLFGKGSSKANAYGASIIHFIGGIHEIYFPFVLMNPVLVIAAIAGGAVGTFLLSIFNVGLVGVASPGSIISIMIMAAAGDRLKILIAILAAAAVSFLISAVIVKNSKQDEEESNKSLKAAAKQMEALKGKKSRVSSVFEDKAEAFDYSKVKKIVYVCDAGLGSSAMGASVIAKKLKKAGIEDVEVTHISVANLPKEADLLVTHESLSEVVKEKQPDTKLITIQDYLNAPEYDELVKNISSGRS